MRGIRIARLAPWILSIIARPYPNVTYTRSIECARPITEATNSEFSFFSSSFSTSNLEFPSATANPRLQEGCRKNGGDDEDSDNDADDDNDEEEDGTVKQLRAVDEGLVRNVNTVVGILCELGGNRVEMKNKLEQCRVRPTEELVDEVLSRVRNDWETAFTFFLWAGKQPGYAHSVGEYHLMLSILGKMRKFDTAWALIDEMRGSRNGVSLVKPHTLLIMIRRYCAVHDVGRAINTFYAYKRFKFDMGMDEFHSLLSALCRYKNVQDAEHLMFCNKDIFPFNTKSFNIVLNGWCNLIGSPREAERVWMEMSKRGIRYDVASYASIMSCHSKAGNLYKVFKLYERMKKMGIIPDRKVYNAVIHALAKDGLVKEAINLMKTMEEKGIAPDIVTYNSLIKPFCRAQKIVEAWQVFEEMLQRGLSPTIRTYHAFLRMVRTAEEVFVLLEKMREMDCQPTIETYIMLIRKFCRWHQLDNVFKVWDEIRKSGLGPDRSSYIVLIHGLFLNGKLEEAYKFYTEMKEKQLLLEPKIEEKIQAWLANKHIDVCQIKESKDSQSGRGQSGKQTRAVSVKHDRKKDFVRRPETRIAVRERGFSF
ncbi:putative Pentatricopeptide repeat-containing protein [Tripterygium wilfordii]|uniref:Putative Pentatricopeptide repeat-containing protein n=1 Tax=Tripterygium wilfordii TaxID=458696 RepID=A0A7J7BVW4_TRIWF|nr:pentatricopeptide repeat-containing protein At5g15010, mitochondrial-like [Tripterygium wilfordii]XP_038696222.1 pentatricopeptide repeat-containing protein At5g15010, mitochondrial-like [Tripterygium wilfordii]XP_038696223.1 pentatricopeptide repeat-containing protein At5g15010, mitochondrial-like [Tripterygium wilfordii]XP_038696224.1 pentatricopeptide repeat-containing protein At5g15010, mitochondrial-like [Tripterygium wilfordii]XP_038696225.1 pentatricopeptide repeat-containing protein 